VCAGHPGGLLVENCRACNAQRGGLQPNSVWCHLQAWCVRLLSSTHCGFGGGGGCCVHTITDSVAGGGHLGGASMESPQCMACPQVAAALAHIVCLCFAQTWLMMCVDTGVALGLQAGLVCVWGGGGETLSHGSRVEGCIY
jgi:hypothetical protein